MPVTQRRNNCEKCGLPWIGNARCECGWDPDKDKRIAKIALAILAVIGVGCLIYMSIHLHEVLPDNAAANKHLITADDDMHRGDFPEAVDEYKAAALNSPKRADIHQKLAIALLNAHKPNEGLDEMRQAHKLDPKDKKTALALTGLLEQNYQDGEAAQVLEGIIKDEPKDSMLRMHLAELYERTNKPEQAAQIYRNFAEMNPLLAVAWVGLSRVQESEGKKDQAIETLKKGLVHWPQDAVLHQRLGLLLGQMKRTNEAVKELTLSAKLAPALAEYNSQAIATLTSDGKPKVYEIPLSRHGQHYVVEALLNERTKVHLLLDPNSDMVSISPAVIKKLDTSSTPVTPVLLPGPNGTVLARKIDIASIRVGQAKEVMVPTAVVPLTPSEDGVLGMSFLRRFDFSIDDDRKVLLLRKNIG